MGPLQPEQGSSVVTSNSGPGPNENQGNTGSLTNVSSPPRVVLWTRLPGRIHLSYIQILIKVFFSAIMMKLCLLMNFDKITTLGVYLVHKHVNRI